MVKLYVALSRLRNCNNVKVLVKTTQIQGRLFNNNMEFMPNIIYHEIFQANEICVNINF